MKAHGNAIPPPAAVELHTFTFRLRGHGQDIPAVTVRAENEKKAFREAYKSCKSFELPGWSLACVETGTSQPAVEFHDGAKKKRA